jgi:hypothetical protein
MVMNLKSSAVICGVALFTAIFFVTELGARGLGGGGRGGGGGGFSRAGVASGAGFSARSGQRASQPMQRQNVGAGSQGNRQEMAGTRKATPQGSREEGRGSQNQDDRQDWADSSREDRQQAAKDRQEDRQDFVADELDDDDGEFLAGAIVGGVIVGAAASASSSTTYVATLPCTAAAVVVNGISYYNCSSAWYQRGYSGSQVTYIAVAAPPGY